MDDAAAIWEAAGTWFGAVGTWAAAVLTLAAVGVAVWTAVGSRRDAAAARVETARARTEAADARRETAAVEATLRAEQRRVEADQEARRLAERQAIGLNVESWWDSSGVIPNAHVRVSNPVGLLSDVRVSIANSMDMTGAVEFIAPWEHGEVRPDHPLVLQHPSRYGRGEVPPAVRVEFVDESFNRWRHDEHRVLTLLNPREVRAAPQEEPTSGTEVG